LLIGVLLLWRLPYSRLYPLYRHVKISSLIAGALESRPAWGELPLLERNPLNPL
jgi:hypothetical protein